MVDLPGGSYAWSPGTFGDVDQIDVSPSSTTDYQVVYTLDGCSSTDISTVTVNPGLTLTMTDDVICDGEQATVYGAGMPSGGTYDWMSPPAPAGSNVDSISVMPTQDTYYPLTYSLNGCTVLDSALVTVKYTPSVTVDDANMCEGTSADLIGVPDSSGGSYFWTPGNLTSPQITVSPSSTTTYTLEYRINGCLATTTADVIVAPAPTVSVNPETICEGDSVELFATVTPAGGDYLWDHNSSTTPSIWVQPNTSTSYNVVYSFGGCDAGASGLVTVNPIPTIGAGSNAPVCLGDDLNLTVTTNASDYDWSGPNGFQSNDQNPVVVNVQDADSGQYYVTVTLNGCTNIDSTYVVVNTAVADFSILNAQGCEPFEAVFTNESINSVSCSWDFGDLQTSNDCDPTLSLIHI